MDSGFKNEFPVGNYITLSDKNAENFFFWSFCFYNFLIWSLNRNLFRSVLNSVRNLFCPKFVQICLKNSDLSSYFSYSSLGHIKSDGKFELLNFIVSCRNFSRFVVKDNEIAETNSKKITKLLKLIRNC